MNKKELIEILLDKNLCTLDREEAAGWLSEFTDNETLFALCKIGRDPSENDFLLETIGISIGEILVKRGCNKSDECFLEGLMDISYREASAYLKTD